MFEYRYGGKQGTPGSLEPTDEFVAIRAPSDELESLEAALEALPEVDRVLHFEGDELIVLRPTAEGRGGAMRARVLESLEDEAAALPVDRVLRDAAGQPVVYTDKIFVKFGDHATDADVSRALSSHPVVGRTRFPSASKAFIVRLASAVGTDVFRIASELLQDPAVELAHPELLREIRRRHPLGANAITKQWHLAPMQADPQTTIEQHCNVVEAWQHSRGAGIVIAVMDDGVDTEHREFSGDGKVVHGFDATRDRPGGAPVRRDDNHGTACAGVACATGVHRAAGVAPEATLMPIRSASGLGSFAEVLAFQHAVEHGADVISCSWGPIDGQWWDAGDPQHSMVAGLPDATRLAIDHAIETGREGKGCVIVWAAGNGNESVDNDGYASYAKVIAVAACNDQGKRSVYSDYGDAIWCAFPSNDMEHEPFGHPKPISTGIWTTDRRGQQGYNRGHISPAGDDDEGDADGNYTATFGGTSSACPGVAGIAALMLAINPDLQWHEVKDLIRQACDRIDEGGGGYDADGHSKKYGYGRVNAGRAVQLARSHLRTEEH